MSNRILVVEDDKNQRCLYQEELSSEGYDVDMASNADEALEKIKNSKFDLVVLDICMPGKDGIETLSEIIGFDNMLPVVLNTAYGTYKENFMTWSAEAYVIKSSDLTELKSTIKTILEKRKVEI